MKVIKCGHLFSTATGAFDADMNVFIDGTKIVEVSTRPPEVVDEVIDLSNKYVLPGLIDCHVHTMASGGPGDMGQIGHRLTPAFTVTSVVNAQAELMGGFTTVRDEGSIAFSDVAVRDAIAKGETWGTRMFCSGIPLSATGGHADTHFAPEVGAENLFGLVCNGPDACLAAARYNFKYGADQIKVMSTGGVMSECDVVGAPEFTYEELKVICDLAKSRGRITSAHAHAGDGIKNAVRAGITSIEHGTMADEEAHSMMLEMGTWLVPTLSAGHNIMKHGVQAGIPAFIVEKCKIVIDSHFTTFRRAYEMGIHIAFGTDCGTPFTKHGQQASEFSLMVQAGCRTKDAILSATSHAAQLLGLDKELGSVQAGKIADIIAVDENPLDNIAQLEKVVFVMKEGKVYTA